MNKRLPNHLGMQLGVDLSTSHEANSFIGTGLTDAFDPAEDHIVDWAPVDEGLGPDNPTAPPCSAIFSPRRRSGWG